MKQVGTLLGVLECSGRVDGDSEAERRQERNFWLKIYTDQYPEMELATNEEQTILLSSFSDIINSCEK